MKVCLITGATSGIGFAAARQLVTSGTTVVVCGRSPAKCQAAAEQLGAGKPRGRADWVVADLTRLNEVRRLAAEFCQRYDRLDVLINNAGVIPARRIMTPDGFELALAVNHVAPFLLTNLLGDLLLSSSPARVINVTSVAHERARLDFADMQMEAGFRPFRAYARSKLANLLCTYELARRLDGTGVTANAADPGLVRTGLGRGHGPLRDFAWVLTHLRYRSTSLTPEQGADTVTYLADSPSVENVTGQYFYRRMSADSSPASRDVTAAQTLWALTERWTGIAAAHRDPRSPRLNSAPLGKTH